MNMKTYKIEIIMDAVDEDDFISAVMELSAKELREHVEEE